MNQYSDPILPVADVLNNYEHGKFVLSNLAAKRAKQLKEGAPPLVRIESNHPLSIALAEIAAGKIKAVLAPDSTDLAVVEVMDIPDTLPSELGILLPALDESEAELLGVGLLGDDHDEHEDEAEVTASLTDLLGDAELETETVAPETEDTVSLDELEVEENAEDEDGDPDASV